jgi:hypothetical protein
MFVNCPHCDMLIEIVELNCRIFRCGIFKISGVQIPPHALKTECDRWASTGKIYGCGKPFLMLDTGPVVCDYI